MLIGPHARRLVFAAGKDSGNPRSGRSLLSLPSPKFSQPWWCRRRCFICCRHFSACSPRRSIPLPISMPSTVRSPSPSWMRQAKTWAIAAPWWAKGSRWKNAALSAGRLHRHGGPALLFAQWHRSAAGCRARCSWICAPVIGWRAVRPSPSRPPRSSIPTQQRTVSRKLAELIDAAGLEKSLSKKQILELYLNRIYLGSAAYGVDGAAHVYFGISARDLTLAAGGDAGDADPRAVRVLAPARSFAPRSSAPAWCWTRWSRPAPSPRRRPTEARAHPATVIDRTSCGCAQLLPRHRRRPGQGAGA